MPLEKQRLRQTVSILFIWLVFSLSGCRTSVNQNQTIADRLQGAGESAVQSTEVETALTPLATPEMESEDVPTSTPSENQVAPATPALATNRPMDLSPTNNGIREITVLYTNDEHGWMEGIEEDRGAANLVGTWIREHDYTSDGPFLIISGGDMWTGPAISTWFDGQSMAEVMNAMGYSAAAVGNHEFDFGLEALRARASESTFPFVSANIRRKSDGQTPTEWGIEPYTLTTINGIRIGIIGLTTVSTPRTTNPANVTEFEFIDYERALRQVVPDVVAAGADLIVVPGHVCEEELRLLAGRISDLPVALLGGGHCNELLAAEYGTATVLIGGSHLASYAYAHFTVNTDNDQVIDVSYGTDFTSERTEADPVVEDIVTKWQAEAEEELNLVIGYLDRTAQQRDSVQQALITETWLWGYPSADVALTNLGGFRADLPAGDLTLGGIITVFPFNNVLVEIELTGRQLLGIVAQRGDRLAIGGMRQAGARWILNSTGEPIDTNATYSVLVNDFMYAGGDSYDVLAEYDPEPYNTAIDWRQPLIDWIEAQESSASRPIDDAIDGLRGR